MNKSHFSLFAIILILLSACQSKQSNNSTKVPIHEVISLEVLQANAYTYLLVSENGNDQWIAVPKTEAQIGETYYYTEFLPMENFKSKDLQRNFSSIYFIQDLSTEKPNPDAIKKNKAMAMPAGHGMANQKRPNTTVKTGGVQIEPAKGGISIEALYANAEKYSGKKVKIKGIVVKANLEIMNRNWYHIQDGSGKGNDFDLTVTSQEDEIEIGDIVTFEGTIALNRDFGYGYAYDIIMEKAKIK